MKKSLHQPVMFKEVLDYLQVRPGGIYVDATFGQGGHSQGIVEQLGVGGRLIAFDLDQTAFSIAQNFVSSKNQWPKFVFFQDNFSKVADYCNEHDYLPVDGVVFDLGWSASLLESGKGYSYEDEEALDMRFSGNQSYNAADIINNFEEEELVFIFSNFGQLPKSKRIARALVERREKKAFLSASDLSNFLQSLPFIHYKKDIRAQLFQALRIVVNKEFENFQKAIFSVVDLLAFGGKVVVISFHSLEHRLVKRSMKKLAGDCVCFKKPPLCKCSRKKLVKIITKKPVEPTKEEVEANPRSRSAQLRVIQKLEMNN